MGRYDIDSEGYLTVRGDEVETLQQELAKARVGEYASIFDAPSVVFEKILDTAVIPTHNQHSDVGMDFYAAEPVQWVPVTYEEQIGHDTYEMVSTGTCTAMVRTGLKVNLPPQLHLRFASRSGLATRNLVYAMPGTVDNSYRGELMIQLISLSPQPPELGQGARIAQGIIFRSEEYNIMEGGVDVNTSRGEAGFGSTGVY